MQCDEFLVKQIDDLKKQIHDQQVEYDNKIEKMQKEYNAKTEKLQQQLIDIKEKSIADKFELKTIVKEGTYEAIEKFGEKQDAKFKHLEEKVDKKNLEYDNRLRELETEKLKKWQFARKTAVTAIITTSISWLVTSLITNFIMIHR